MRTGRYWLGACVAAAVAVAAPAADPHPDQLIVDTLKSIHNRGAELYNRGDAAGCYRLYEGSLATVRPLLARYPAAQKAIDAGLAEVAGDSNPRQQAFRLHEVIEDVRASLKKEIAAAAAAPKAVPKLLPPEPKPEPKKVDAPPAAPKVETPPPPAPKPAPKVEAPPPPAPKPMPKVEPPPPAPKPEPKKVDAPPPAPKPAPKPETPPMPKPAAAAADGATATGTVTIEGKPLAKGTLTLVSLKLKEPRVVTADVVDGAYKIDKPVPAGEYAAAVTGAGVPAKFEEVAKSPLRMTLQNGANTINVGFKKD